METTTQLETVNVMVQKFHVLGNQQPSRLTAKGSTTIPFGSTLKRVEARSTYAGGEDIVSSIGKPVAADRLDCR